MVGSAGEVGRDAGVEVESFEARGGKDQGGIVWKRLLGFLRWLDGRDDIVTVIVF